MLDWPLPFHSPCLSFLTIQVQGCLRVPFQVNIPEITSWGGMQDRHVEAEKPCGSRNSGAEDMNQGGGRQSNKEGVD